uniref:NTR domain-containing protein n=1 Tax=Sphaeramia orbicularis TaxID=375764 RepID=A0A672ZP21_9TELE
MSAPNLLRVGTPENIFVECQDCENANEMNVRITVKNHPTKSQILTSTAVVLNSANNFQALGQIMIPARVFSKDPTMKQYVYLQAQFPDYLLEKVVLVNFQSGYIFIQTDKTLYTPNSRVYFRMFAVTPHMLPVERDQAVTTIEMMTPDGTILPLDPVSLRSGIYSGYYNLGEIVSPGLWRVVAKFQSNPQQNYSTEFEVKEYMLPTFEVKLTPGTSFFHVDSQELTVNIRATYMFGEDVDGTAYVVFGVLHEGQKRSFPYSLQRVPINGGHGQVTLQRRHILQTFQNIQTLVGMSIFVSVSVLTQSGSEMVEAELRGIQIVTSPYTINLKKTPKYFKPGMGFDVTVEVLNPDRSPAQGVPVVVEPGTVQGFTVASGIAKLTINTRAGVETLQITAKTNDPGISTERQASATMRAVSYRSNSNKYIHIGVDTAELDMGDNLKMNLILNQPNQQNDITYLILSRGQLVKHGRYRTQGQVLISLIESITKEMLPSFRIIAYYHTSDNEIVSDSVWVDVKDSCMGSLRLEPARPALAYEPRRMFSLKVTGDPGATVGLVAVDKGVYVLNNKHRLTQKKVWDTVEQYDTGCTPGGGRDGLNVFYDAGLLFESNTASGTPYRQELKCPTLMRRKRDSTVHDDSPSLGKNCSNFLSTSNATFVTDFNNINIWQVSVKGLSYNVDVDDSYMDSDEIVSRTRFPESWLWADVTLPHCPPNNRNCDSTSHVKNVPLQDSITAWHFIGISLSSTHGICVGEPLEVIVRKEFFIDLRLPYSAVRGEQVEVKAVLHNYSPDAATVRLDILEQENVCSVASKRGKYRQEVTVGSYTTRTVPFVIIPMREGEFTIEVKAAVKDAVFSDGVMKTLRVVPEGILIRIPQTVILDPKGGRQEVTINSGIPQTDLVRNSPSSTQIYVTGQEQVGALVENAISGNSMGSLIYQPSGEGEANMIHMTLPVIATIYLDKTNQWETVGFQKRNEALQHIMTGYTNQLKYRKQDGSFAVFANRQSSTWLTAYVVKVFAMVKDLVTMQANVLCDAVRFLILNTQQLNGMFREVGTVAHGEMIGDVRGVDSDASMTAFCLIAMQESRRFCAASVNSLSGSIDKAVDYLEKRLPTLTNPYAVAMTSYALANENKLNKEILYNFVSPELNHWPLSKGNIYTLEATAYALLALVKAEAFEDARPVVRWLKRQPRVGGGYRSTQATIMVYQAVAEYWSTAQEPEYDLDVDIFLPGRPRPNRFHFNRFNYYATRTTWFRGTQQNVTVRAAGTGEATLKIVSHYYARPREQESDCQKFNLSVELIPESMSEDEKVYKLKISLMYMDRDNDAAMTILDIGLLTGFTADTNDLNLLSKGPARTIAKYEMNEALSERGSLIIYLDKVSHTQPEEVAFRVRQTFKVGVLQPAVVSVYEYYDQTPCLKFYHPERVGGKLLRLCRNEDCTCAEENCSMQKKEKIGNDQRKNKICEGTTHFAYKVRLENMESDLSTDIYNMRIETVIKEGSYDVGPQGRLRPFLGYQHCREALDLRPNKTYLVMGTASNIHRNEQHQTVQYVLEEQTWIEYVPTDAECRTKEYRSTCLGLEDMAQKFIYFGCEQ